MTTDIKESETTDPAPAVCVWTDAGRHWLTSCSEGDDTDYNYCPSCGKPIAFTEAK